MKGIQLIGILVTGYLIAQTIVAYKRGNHGLWKTAFWLSLWMSMAILFAFPSLTLLALPILTIQDAMLGVLVFGLVVAYFLVYQTTRQLERMERKLTELAQNMAMHDYVKEALEDSEEKNDER